MSSPSRLPREMVLASAGTGKTYRLTSRIIGLLEHGAPPEEVLASTFTRNAAAEILNGVLFRIAGAALDGEDARALAEDALLGAGRELDPPAAARLLETLAGRLHRFEVGTLDSVFVRMARTFWPELDLSPRWTIADPPTAERLRSEALQDVLSDGRRDVLVELVRMLARGDSTRRVHDRLMSEIEELHRLRREIDPAAREPWAPFRERPRPDDPGARRRELVERVREAELPTNASGDPNGHWVNARDRLVEELRSGDWEAVLKGGLGAGALEEDFRYRGTPPPEDLRTCLDEVRELAAAELQQGLAARARAMGRLAERFSAAYARRQREEGAYRFEDLTHRLGGGDGIAHREDLGYRLDRRIRHLLLDEFQDTSLSQWETLEPLVDRTAARPAEEGAVVVVADPKQSIYGWRGADPRLLDRIRGRYDLRSERLERSWRSSPVVLDFVNDVFRDLPGNPVVREMEHGPEVAAAWSEALSEHRPAPPRADLPGYVRVEVGPEAELGKTAPAATMVRAAERVADLHGRAPDATVGVLTRTNAAVARLIRELRRRGVEASEEGGTSVSESPPVAAVLSLLRLADHPGDTVARYHVSRTPLGPVVGLSDHDDEGAARRTGRRVRRRLVDEGYGPTLAGWVDALAGSVDARELRRLRQLVELGYRWPDDASLRPGEFIRFVESERVEDPSAARVRVMTVHQAKGLEFDAVVLPELDASLAGRGGEVALPERDPDTGRVRRIFPGVRKDLRPLFPEMAEAHRQHREADLRDAFSLLYVAMTRARQAVHVLTAENAVRPSSSAKRFSRLLLAALGREDVDGREGEVLWEVGDPEWHRSLEREGAAPGGSREREPGPLRVDPSRAAGRMLRHRTPSDLEAGARIPLGRRLDLRGGEGRLRGRVVHAWLGEITWWDGEVPDREALDRIARREAPGVAPETLEELRAAFRGWLEEEPLRGVLVRDRVRERLAAGIGAVGDVDAANEWPFVHRTGEEIVSGRMDRRILVRSPGEGPSPGPAVAAEVVDYKVEAPSEEAAERYGPQIREYRRALAALTSLDPGDVTGRLVFLAPGGGVEVRTVTGEEPG